MPNRLIQLLISLTTGALTIFSFQNCSDVQFASVDEKVSLAGASFTTVVHTKMNTPVDFQANTPADMQLKNFKISMRADQGVLDIVDAQHFKMRFNPAFGFRGSFSINGTADDENGLTHTLHILFEVGNSIADLEPALAIRGMACIQCHAQVASNIITDYGFGGNGKDHDYYFGKDGTWNRGHAYGDHGQSLKTMKLTAGNKFIVPAAARLPTAVADATGLEFLNEYISAELAKGTTETQQVIVEERASVWIGAPTAVQIEQRLQLGADQRIKYYKDASDSVELSGFKLESDFVRNDGTVRCEGDVAIRGPLYLENLNLYSRNGCRIYVIGSVFAYGPLQFESETERSNLQISSTKAVLVGLGETKRNGEYCDPNGKYASNPAGYSTASSLRERVETMWTVPQSYVRQSSTPVEFGKTIVAEAALIEKITGVLYDAECRPEGRPVSFRRILLNAPIVHSRYTGQVEGTIIAEFSQMTLSNFKFKFDPVLKTVPILPFLEPQHYLDVQ